MNENELITSLNKFISRVAYLWKKGFPNSQDKRYKFKEVSELTEDRLLIQHDMNGRKTVFLDGAYIGSLDIICEISNIMEPDLEADINICFSGTHELVKGFTVPTEVSVSLYYILLKILKENPEEAKFKFERLGFEGFYERTMND